MSDVAIDAGIGAAASRGALDRIEGAAEAAARAARAGRTDDAAERFEALLATLLVKELRRALPEGTLFPGAGSDVYDSWFDEHAGAALAESDALGLASAVRVALSAGARAREEDR